jgi:DNA-binding transcriptional ArsR family regulator
VVVRVPMSARALGMSRFATSPTWEVVGVLRQRDRHPAPHARAWYRRARQTLSPGHLELLEALVPDDHPYTPDFLTPIPRPGETMDQIAARIALMPAEEAEYLLDVGFRGRRIWPHVAAWHRDVDVYERWRRPMPPLLGELAKLGGSAVASAAAEAMMAFLEVLAPDWPRVQSVLEADITHRADSMASGGAAALLGQLSDSMHWNGTEILLDRPYSGVIDWAHDGVLLVPVSTHIGPVVFTAETPHTPVLTYAARGISALWELPSRREPSALADLIGITRAAMLTSLDVPRSTMQLSRETGWSMATVSYHLGILLRADLVQRARRGRAVLYRPTGFGTSLVARMARRERESG